MLAWLRGKRSADAATALSEPATCAAFPASDVAWQEGTSLPIPDWERQTWPGDGADANIQHAFANGVAAAWLDATAVTLEAGYRRTESANFMLLSPLETRATRVLLDYLERSRRRVLATLPGIAAEEGHGKTVVLVFHDEESYYRYIAHYGSSSSEPEAFSGGMFIDYGCGHFVFVAAPFESMEAVVVHELTHCLLRHLPLPAWLNEGLAVNTEQRFVPARPRYRPNELQFLFGQFWTAETIQEFWSGKSFLRPDDGQPLSYELARLLVQLLDKDFDALARFCISATRDDGGERAAVAAFSAGLDELASVVLGAGDWRPQPERWAGGTEKGQFRG